eukprot:s1592_g7.t2
MQAGEALWMVGDDDELGAWNPLLGKRLSYKEGKTWAIRRPLKRGMSMTYKFVSVSTENGDFYGRWENRDNRVFKKPYAPLKDCVEVTEITDFGEKQLLTTPAIQPSQQEVEDSALAPEPQPSRGTFQETETTSASERTGVQDCRCQDDSAKKFDRMTCEPECLRGDTEVKYFKLCESQEQKDESVNTLRLPIVGLESSVDVVDSNPPQAVSVDVNLPAQKWLDDCSDFISSKTQHVLEDQSCVLCQKAQVTPALLSTGVRKFETFETVEPDAALQNKLAERITKLETDAARQAELLDRIAKLETHAALQEKLLDRIAKLETDAVLQTESVAALQAKARHVDSKIDSTNKNLSQMEGSQYLKDCRMSQKQQELENITTCVQRKIKHITTLISDLETRFEKVEGALASPKHNLASLTSDFHTRFAKLESAIASQKSDLDTLSSDSDRRLKEVESVMESHEKDLATITSGTCRGFDKVERVIASHKNELATRLAEVESVMASHKNDLSTLTSKSHTRFEKVECVMTSSKNEFATLTSDIHTRLEEMESLAASQRNELASQKKSLLGQQRQINNLDLKIPEQGDFPPSLDSAAQKEIQQTQQQLKALESQVASLRESLQRMSENNTSAAKLKLPSSIAAPPLHPTKVELQPARAQPTVVQNEDLDEWNDVGLQPGDLEAKGRNVEQPQSNARACSKPDDLKAAGKSAFCGFQVPPKPEDEAIAKVCLEVEEKLHAAVRQNDPLDARKTLLRKVLLRLHPDQTGAPSAGMCIV